jgi:prophage endopeptidase
LFVAGRLSVPYLSLIKYAAPFIAGVGAMWLYHSAVVSGMREDVAVERQEYAERSQFDAWVLQQRITEIDAKHTKELSDAQEVSRLLSADLASGRKRLSIAATCKPLPETSSSGVGNGGIAILDRISEQAYSDHRALIEKKDAQIRVLQALLR